MSLDIDIIRKVCLERGLKENTISSFPTFVDQRHKMPNGNFEGFEVKGGKITPFWAISGQKDYNEPTGDYILQTIQLIGERSAIIHDVNEPIEEPKNIKDAVQKDKAIITTDCSNAELPEFFTPALLTKWGQMNTMDRVLLFQQTPISKIDHVIVSKKNGKEITAPYVKGNYMFKEANAAFLFDWYLSETTITVSAKGVSVVGTLNAWFKEYNKYLQRPATGYKELNAQVDSELAKKGATTDAIKKGLSLFGFNSDVYSGERD